MICCVTFIIMNFTDWVGSRPVRTEYGWAMNCLVFVIIAFNLGYVLWYGFGSMRLMCRKYKNLITHYCKSKNEITEEPKEESQVNTIKLDIFKKPEEIAIDEEIEVVP